MKRFRLSGTPIDVAAERGVLVLDGAGAVIEFDGRVRNHNDGRAVEALDYQAYAPLAEDEGNAILAEAMARFRIVDARAVHRTGALEIGDIAVWIGVSAGHRGAAFDACRFVIDEIKRRVPIWKREHYVEGDSDWLHPDGTAADGPAEQTAG
ncbi:MAG: molybdenum cofactor biosynthesis protein MoaE [Lysobacterales bacterium]